MRGYDGMMDGAGWMGFSMGIWMLLGVALLVLSVVAIVRLWPKRAATFHSSEPGDDDRRDPPRSDRSS